MQCSLFESPLSGDSHMRTMLAVGAIAVAVSSCCSETPGMTESVLVLGGDSVPLGSGDTVLVVPGDSLPASGAGDTVIGVPDQPMATTAPTEGLMLEIRGRNQRRVRVARDGQPIIVIR